MNPEKLFNDIAAFISDSKSLLDAGAMMELGNLDQRVQELCQAVLALSQEDRQRYSDKLQQLFNELSVLGESMAAQRDLLANEIRGVAQHKKANVAYRIVDASDDGGPKEE